MNSQNLVLVSFNRDQLQMVEFEGQPYVVMKPIVKSLKLDWRTQQAKLLENKKNSTMGLSPYLPWMVNYVKWVVFHLKN